MTVADVLAPLALFRDLTAEQRAGILASMKRRDVIRGERLVIEGDRSDALFIVLHGAFEVIRRDNPSPIARIGAGEVVGEVGFFARGPRTATVAATRDATVLELDRAAYERMAQETPSIVTSLLAAIARRLADTTARLPPRRSSALNRTVAVVHGGREPIPPAFFERLRRTLAQAGAHVIDRDTIAARFGAQPPDSSDVTYWLNHLEWDHELLVYIADLELTDWTRKCVRQADLVLLVTRGEASGGALTPVESFVCDVHAPATRRLVRVHDRRVPVVAGTTDWLRRADVFMHHHVSLEDEKDFRGLVRFLTGRAIGLVGGGGGAFGVAHLGIYRACLERRMTFDVFIGTSVGAAMLAGFAMLSDPEDLDAGTHEIFVRRRGFKRPTWPRYALLDHKAFDEALASIYGRYTLIEDCWRPFFAVATNLSTQRLELIRSGVLWRAVRASSSIPAVLPPLYTDDGMMLVDGGVMDNAPLAPLQEIKNGPNVIVHFGRSGDERFECRYDDIPGRLQLVASLLNPFARRRLPRVPGVGNVLVRTLLAHQRYDLPIGPHDLLLLPPPFPGSSFLNFDQHTKVYRASHAWAVETLDALARSGNVALAAILAAARQGDDVSPASDSYSTGLTAQEAPAITS